MAEKMKVLVICTGNSARSQMAEAFINGEMGDRWQAYSAGVNPSKVNPIVVKVMGEIGYDLSQNKSKSVDMFLDKDLDLVITVCDRARQTCPAFLRPVDQHHISFADPSEWKNLPEEEVAGKMRELRDEIKKEILDYLQKYEAERK